MAPKLRRTAVGQVNRASIVPENQVVVLPAMAINGTRLGTMDEKESKKLVAFRLREVENNAM